MQNVLKASKSLESTIQEAEEELECISRQMLKARLCTEKDPMSDDSHSLHTSASTANIVSKNHQMNNVPSTEL
ncbi:conserved hypothetical protein [Ricinus communis]|uniref:Uncharacterized protein n=1 Tax=Ricinus communis TaxID=3988 RepID=B9R8K4_RICCO|nr:conserved hypothetical protein [Ricinus communis]